ncbi:hypothetical protein ABL78_7666 [Leptomonas seymouri]|uniref:Uncharacterized protein n=1 Tax=Leptomonas seymouri TaxID=5684 RepID=A0A0N0P367_LEPSE|nr:hypothetical protein ABL78_7666 [Leptomonas seymouri]|eukprot:KPI83307.1 hypothetical protein ABL78_7666 [Leptomonas seymouri]
MLVEAPIGLAHNAVPRTGTVDASTFLLLAPVLAFSARMQPTSLLAASTAALRCTAVCRRGASSGSSSTGSGYRFFEDMYPKHDPAPRYTYYEDQVLSASVKSLETKKQLTESEKMHHLHNWRKDRDGLTPPPEFGWPEEWGPEPGEEGHSEWYKKNRMYMSYEEKSRYDLRSGVPVEKNSMRHQEMPYHKRMKAAYVNLEEKNPQYFDPRQRKYWAEYSYEDQKDTMAKARDEYLNEWLEQPGVTKENVAKKIGDYNGTAKNQNIKSVQRRPEWELAPRPEYDD